MFIPDYIETVLRKLKGAGFPSYVAGGCVRDSLLCIAPKDYDVATPAKPDEVLDLFAGIKTITAGVKHGTVGIVIGGNIIEITTFRFDGEYSDHRRPSSVVYSGKVEDDLARRDFTVNAMAYSPDKGIIDPFGGRQDLNDGILRTVGEPVLRFTEDALRIFRGVRFASVYGLEPEPKTICGMTACAPLLTEISKERICTEFFASLSGAYSEKYLFAFKELMAPVIPELAAMAERSDFIHGDMLRRSLFSAKSAGGSIWLRLAALFEYASPRGRRESAQIASEVLFRLKADRKTRERVSLLICEPELDDFSRPGLRRLIARLKPEQAEAFLRLRKASAETAGNYETAKAYKLAAEIASEIVISGECVSLKTLDINGNDLKALGMVPGKRIGLLLKSLLDEVLDGKIENKKSALAARASELEARIKGSS